MKTQLSHTFEDIVSVDNLLEAWREFLRGKRGKRDVQEFSLRLMDNIMALHEDLASMRYHHGGYRAFHIFDPKPRHIHKASVRDRLLHHAIYRILYPFFDKVFIADSFSCRLGKGTHRALNRFRAFAYRVSQNHTRTCWVLKCDIRKFFASIDHTALLSILEKYITDRRVLWLLGEVVGSFSSTRPGVGLPLGNLTSQLFVNIYMNEFDQFVKHHLKVQWHVRYADDFVVLSKNRSWLEGLIPQFKKFLNENLRLRLHPVRNNVSNGVHPEKVFIKTLASGVDFLGWVHFPDHRVLRTTTKKRMIKRLESNAGPETVSSYLGLLNHGNTYKLQDRRLRIR